VEIIAGPLTPTDLDAFCTLPGLSTLTPDLVGRHQPDLSFLAVSDGPAARCSLWWTRVPTLPGEKLGLIGHYAARNADAASALLVRACERLAAAGCTRALAPIDGNTWRRYRLLTDRGSEPTFFLEPDNPDDWPVHFTTAGFAPFAEYYSYLNDDLSRRTPRTAETAARLAAQNVAVRPLNAARFLDDLRAVYAVSAAAFPQNFLYTPIGEEEFLSMYRGLEAHLRPELVLIAEAGGAPVGYLFAVPDLAQAQRGQPIDTMIAKTLAVRPEFSGGGLGSWLLEEGHKAGQALGFRRCIHALMHQDNRSVRISSHTARATRRYTLFSRPLDGRS
jgi:GNAT superfamily N-acetyltransferase